MLRIHLCLLGCLASHAMSPPVSPPLEERMTGWERRGEERRGRKLYENASPFYSGGSARRRRLVIKQAGVLRERGGEVERWREKRERRK